MLNSVVLAGNLGNDPEIHLQFRGGVHRNPPTRFPRSQKKDWLDQSHLFSNNWLESVEKHLHKGADIAVSGILDHSQMGNKRRAKRSTNYQ